MYYLEDKHPEYEYAIYTRIKSGTPFLNEFPSCFNYFDIMRKIEEIKKRHNRYNQLYYFDNDFIENDYNPNVRVDFYYRVLRRPVSDYKVLTKADFSSSRSTIITFMWHFKISIDNLI